MGIETVGSERRRDGGRGQTKGDQGNGEESRPDAAQAKGLEESPRPIEREIPQGENQAQRGCQGSKIRSRKLWGRSLGDQGWTQEGNQDFVRRAGVVRVVGSIVSRILLLRGAFVIIYCKRLFYLLS